MVGLFILFLEVVMFTEKTIAIFLFIVFVIFLGIAGRCDYEDAVRTQQEKEEIMEHVRLQNGE